nr:hypothetical protein [uncultured Oscillibacter sp.]
MDNPVFDAMLKTALEEALRRDIWEAPEIPGPSRRQRMRMRRLLAEPRSVGEAVQEPEAARRSRTPARWLAVVVIAALLTGTAAVGLGSGGWFRQVYEESYWAPKYGDAADTDQLLGMGVETGAGSVEADGLRIEVLDAVFDGQAALFAIRVTVLDPELLEQLQEEHSVLGLGLTTVFPEGGGAFGAFNSSPLEEEAEGQYTSQFSILNESLNSAGLCRIEIQDLVFFPPERGIGKILRKGPWTLTASPRPTEALRLEPDRVCEIGGEAWTLKSLTLTPLALHLTMQGPEGARSTSEDWFEKNLTFHMKNGGSLTPGGTSRFLPDLDASLQIDTLFPMPLDLDQIESIELYGQDFPLTE